MASFDQPESYELAAVIAFCKSSQKMVLAEKCLNMLKLLKACLSRTWSLGHPTYIFRKQLI